METYGNAAVIAWDGNLALGHMIFVPKIEARKRWMLFHERMLETPDDDKTLIVQAVGFCSIGGQEYRGRGIGTAMAEMIIEWATLNDWHKLQIFDAPSGLFPGHWMDSCMPPARFWKKFGFEIVERTRSGRTWKELRKGMLSDDPRHSIAEMDFKKNMVARVEQGHIPEEEWAYEFDLEKTLKPG